MKAPYKLLWLYILDECNHAGIWQVDFDVAEIKTGEKLNYDQALKSLGNKIIVFDNNEKWFIPDYIDFQYGELNHKNRVHESVIFLLKKYDLINESLKIKPLTSPLEGAKDKEKDKDKDKDMDEDKDKEKEMEILRQKSENNQIYTSCIKIYFDFIKFKTGIGPKLDSSEGQAMKVIIGFFKTVIEVKEKPLLETIPNALQYIFNHWDRLDDFLRNQLKLKQINSNLTNIINQIKNGTSKDKSRLEHLAEANDNLKGFDWEKIGN